MEAALKRKRHLAVPGKHFGLALILVFSDRCGKSALPSSATGSGSTLFPRADGDAQKTVVHERPFLSSTGRGAFFLFGKTKRKNGGRISQPHPAPGARSFVSRSHDSAARCAGRRGRRPLRRRGTPEIFPVPHSEFRIPNYPTGFPGSGSCRNPPLRGGSRGRCSR